VNLTTRRRGTHRRTPEAWADMQRRLTEAESNAALLEQANQLIRKLVAERDEAQAQAEQRARTIGKLEIALDGAEDRVSSE
jgi:adenosyl cobinamide kinase/adenosyl cobinamide phosphate guanylyltransferase